MDEGEVLWGRASPRRRVVSAEEHRVSDSVILDVPDEVVWERFGARLQRPEAPGEGDAWRLDYPCGLRVMLGPAPRQPGRWWVRSDDADLDHALHHLALPGEVAWRADRAPGYGGAPVAEPWLLRRYDDNGQHFDVRRFASRLAAECSLRTFEARGHRQTYVIERAG